jgi:hypothetical protein
MWQRGIGGHKAQLSFNKLLSPIIMGSKLDFYRTKSMGSLGSPDMHPTFVTW